MSQSLSQSGAIYQNALLRNRKSHEYVVEHKRGSNKLAIIIDPRYDAMMKSVIQNFMYYMNPCGWNLLIMSCNLHRQQIMQRYPNCFFSPIESEMIFFDSNGVPNISVDSYNKILMDVNFWKSLPAENICIFQKDCIMFKMFPEYFMQYDFAGANWYTKDISLFNEGVNGGFSLRNRKAMVDCIEKITFDSIENYRRDALINKSAIFRNINREFIVQPLKLNEDVFFTYACEMLNKRMPDVIHRSFLAIEGMFNPDTCVYHGWHYNYHNANMATMMLFNSTLFSNELH